MSTTNGQTYPFGYGDDELQRLGEQHRIWEEAIQRVLEVIGRRRGACSA
jgi:hypothetical protein